MNTTFFKRGMILLGLAIALMVLSGTAVSAQSGPGFAFVPGSATCDTPDTWRISGITVMPSFPLGPFWRRWSQSYPIVPVAPFVIDAIRVNNTQASFKYVLPVNWYTSQYGGWVAGTQGSITINRPACAEPPPAVVEPEPEPIKVLPIERRRPGKPILEPGPVKPVRVTK